MSKDMKELTPDEKALFDTIRNGRLDKVEALLQSVDVNVQDQYGETPLHAAVSNNNLEMIELLLQKGADPNIQDDIFGSTPLGELLMIEAGNPEIAKALINHKGINLDILNKYGSALQRVAGRGNLELVELLLQKGADINIKDRYEWTPLYVAAMNGRVDTVKLLLKHGANSNIASEDGMLPIQFFTHKPEMQRLFFEYGAIPAGMKVTLADIIKDPQSVHHAYAVDHTNFLTEHLLASVTKSTDALHKSAEHYKDEVGKLFEHSNKELAIKLLDLTKQGKYSIMLKTLNATPLPEEQIKSIREILDGEIPQEALTLLRRENTLLSDVLDGVIKESLPKPIGESKEAELIRNRKVGAVRKVIFDNTEAPDDQTFVKTILNKAGIALKDQYLRKKENGEYAVGYPSNPMQYDRGATESKVTTIPKSIGAVVEYIESSPPTLEQQKELLCTLFAKDPDLTRDKISRIKKDLKRDDVTVEQLTTRVKAQELLKDIGLKEISELFYHVSGMHIEPVWREQQKFNLASQCYIAATGYGENNNACIQGTWFQIINTMSEINPALEDQWAKHTKTLTSSDQINIKNIDRIIETFAENLMSDLKTSDNYNVADKLQDVFARIDDLTQDVTDDQTAVLKVINKNIMKAWPMIKEIVPDHRALIPSFEEYSMILSNIATANEQIGKFVASDLQKPEPAAGPSVPANLKSAIRDMGNIKISAGVLDTKRTESDDPDHPGPSKKPKPEQRGRPGR